MVHGYSGYHCDRGFSKDVGQRLHILIVEKHDPLSLGLSPCDWDFFFTVALSLAQQHGNGDFRVGYDAGGEEIAKKKNVVIGTSMVMFIFFR